MCVSCVKEYIYITSVLQMSALTWEMHNPNTYGHFQHNELCDVLITDVNPYTCDGVTSSQLSVINLNLFTFLYTSDFERGPQFHFMAE